MRKGKEISLSVPFSITENAGEMNLIAPVGMQPQVAEYTQLAGDLERQVGGLCELAKARENEKRRDLTLLHQSTGWDARLIALAATASRLREEITAELGIDFPDDGLYALLRAGLPSDKQELARTSIEVVDLALRKANAASIVELERAEDRAKLRRRLRYSRMKRVLPQECPEDHPHTRSF